MPYSQSNFTRTEAITYPLQSVILVEVSTINSIVPIVSRLKSTCAMVYDLYCAFTSIKCALQYYFVDRPVSIRQTSHAQTLQRFLAREMQDATVAAGQLLFIPEYLYET
jgi:hypothetical protein